MHDRFAREPSGGGAPDAGPAAVTPHSAAIAPQGQARGAPAATPVVPSGPIPQLPAASPARHRPGRQPGHPPSGGASWACRWLSPESPAQERNREDLNRILFERAPGGLAISAVNGLLIALILLSVSSPARVGLWYGALVLVLAARVLLLVHYRARPLACSPTQWSCRFTLGAALTGCAWGASVLLLPKGELIYQVFLGFVLAGMTAGAIPSLSPAPLAYRLYLMAVLIPYAISLGIAGANAGGNEAHAFLGMAILFGLFMWLSARHYHSTLLHALELSRDNRGLVADLIRERDRISTLNRDLEAEVRERRTVQEALVRAKDEAESASLAKSQFVANMSHEIRTPMNGVLGMLDMLGQSELSAQQRGLLDIARGSAESLLTVINDVLDFSKIEAGKLDLESIPFDARVLTEDIASLFAASAESKGLELACFVEPRIHCRVIGDPTRLRQVLTNVLGNAIKFTDRGEVLLRLSEVARSGERTVLCFEVRDTGIGMSPAHLQRLFRPFVQADGSTTRRFGGSGLGLAISRNLVELMGGSMEVESRLGMGAHFLIRIPFERIAQLEQTQETQGLQGLRVLAVDDHPTNLDILGHYLTGWGMRYEGAPAPALALVRLRQAAEEGDPFALAILDMQMPGMDGLALARAIRGDAEIPTPRLLLLSSGGGPGAQLGSSQGSELALNKPVRQSLLKDTLLQAMQGAIRGRASEDCPVPTKTATPQPAEPPALRGRVLLAEDNPINQKVACGMLRRLGLEVEIAGDGTEALEQLARSPFDLVLMDVQMPDLDGFETSREIRARERGGGRRITVVAMTASAMSGDRERCLEAGMDDYIAKPVRLAELQRTLARWLPVRDEGA